MIVMFPRVESMAVETGCVSDTGVGGTGFPVSWTSSIFLNFAERGDSRLSVSALRLIIFSVSVAIANTVSQRSKMEGGPPPFM
jgi:hypothetical protein